VVSIDMIGDLVPRREAGIQRAALTSQSHPQMIVTRVNLDGDRRAHALTILRNAGFGSRLRITYF